MRSSAVLLLLLRAVPAVSQDTDSSTTTNTAVCEVAGSSPRSTCKGIQGAGKDADVCCAAECLCTCGGASDANADKECFLTKIRDDPPPYCDGGELESEACSLPAETNEDATACGVVAGVLSDDGFLCCPSGCGLCGGTSCSDVPMSWVQPGPEPLSVDARVPEGATSSDYCCSEIFDNTETICGVDGGEAPCRMPQVFEEKEDTCLVDGISGTAHASMELCCPLGCATCGGIGCGEQHISYVFPGDLPWSTTAPEGSTTSDFCCLSAFKDVGTCGEAGVEPPCLIPEEVVTLPPRETFYDTCGVEGIEGIADDQNCCPLGCGQCGGTGCGSIDMGYITPTLGFEPAEGDTSSAFCCSTTFVEGVTPVCGDEGVLPPCFIEEGTPAPIAVATLSPAELSSLPNTCGLPDMAGILDSSGTRCCPQGCGMCGGSGCGAVDMDLVAPTVVGDVPPTATSSDYCCTSGVDERDVTCGSGGDEDYHPPCYIPADPVEDSCNVEGMEGVADSSRTYCCPLGCGLCGGSGCGSVPENHIFTDGRDFPVDATASTYCCVSSFANVTDECGELGVEPPCIIPDGTPTPPPVAVDSDGAGNLSTPSPAPGSSPEGDTFTASPTTVESTGCDTVLVTIEGMSTFDGVYVMDPMDERLYIRDDTGAMMKFKPYDAEMMEQADSTTTTECGHWVLAEVVDNDFALIVYPQLAVRDCASHPEDIEADAIWMVQEDDGGPLEGEMTGTVDCQGAPVTPAPASADSSGNPGTDRGGDFATTSPTAAGVAGGTASPTVPASQGGDATTVTPPTTIVGNEASGGSGDGGLSTAEAVGIGIGASAVVIIGAVGIARWKAGASG